MGDLTKNISRHELACKCGCGLDTMDWQTIAVVQDACDSFAYELGVAKVSLSISSAARCYKYNRKPASEGGPGSGDGSQHPKCRAMDIAIKGVDPVRLYGFFDNTYIDSLGLGLYNTFVHVDTRGTKARW